MKYFININQLVLSKTKLDLKDCAILDYLRAWCQADDKKVKQLDIKEEGISYRYTWINFKNLIREMPLLGLKHKSSISQKIQKIEKAGYIKTFRAPDRNIYIRLTEKIKEIEFNGGVHVDEQGCSYKRTGGVHVDEQHKQYINQIIYKLNNNVSTIVNYFFDLKGWANKAKEFYQKNKIVYARYTRPAKYLLELCDGNVEEAKSCLKKVAVWAESRNLDWSIETVFKKWYEIDFLKEREKKPYVDGCRVFQKDNRWWIIDRDGEIKEYVGSLNEIVYQ